MVDEVAQRVTRKEFEDLKSDIASMQQQNAALASLMLDVIAMMKEHHSVNKRAVLSLHGALSKFIQAIGIGEEPDQSSTATTVN